MSDDQAIDDMIEWQRREALRYSITVRGVRSRLRNHVRQGGSLAILLREEHPELDNVQLVKLVQWIPMIGEYRSHRLLGNLPPRARLSEISAHERAMLTQRISLHERRSVR